MRPWRRLPFRPYPRPRKHSVGADEITTLSDTLARKTHRLLVVASDELCIGSDAAINCRERIAWAQPQRATRGFIGFFPASAIRQCQSVITLGHREIRIKA